MLVNRIQERVQRAVVDFRQRVPAGRCLVQDRDVRAGGPCDPGPGVRCGRFSEPGGPCVPAAVAVAVVRSPGVAVAQQHGDHEDVPDELQGEVRADEDVAASRLDCGQDRVEPEAVDQFGYRVRGVLTLPGQGTVLFAVGCSSRRDVDPAQVP